MCGRGGAVLITSVDVEKLKVGNNFPWYEDLSCLRAEKAKWTLGMCVFVLLLFNLFRLVETSCLDFPHSGRLNLEF